MNSLLSGRIAWYPFRRGSRIGFCGASDGYDPDYLKRNELKDVSEGNCEYLIYHFDSELRVCPSAINCRKELIASSRRITSGGRFLISFPFAGKDEICSVLDECGYRFKRFYYPFPNGHFPQLIYSDAHLPDESVEEKGAGPGREIYLKDIFIEAATQPFYDESSICFAAISSERIPERAFVTYESSDGFYYKKAIYPEGVPSLDRLISDSVKLSEYGISVLVPERCGDDLTRTPRQTYTTLKQHISDIVKSGNKLKLLDVFDRLYGEISKARPAAGGSVFTEMIPVNTFVKPDGSLLFFDQEYTRNDVGFDYPMFRSIRDLYYYDPEAWKVVRQEELKDRYGLDECWDEYLVKEDIFWNHVKRKGYFLMKDNSDRQTQPINSGGIAIFDPFDELYDKRIILFGTGKYADSFYSQYIENGNRKLSFFADNSPEKIGKKKYGIEIKAPGEIVKLEHGSYRVVIVIKNYEEIYSQLLRMGVYRTDIRIFSPAFHWEFDPYKILNPKTDGKYNIGFTTGVFDLFHIGHLNILKNAKSRCHYLIAGVLSDELTAQDKGRIPIIPYEERAEIVRACGYVNQVVKIDFHNTDKMTCFKELHYGCLFAGGDHADDDYWLTLRDRLLSVGSNLEFFPYTKMTNSSVLRENLKDGAIGGQTSDEKFGRQKHRVSEKLVLMTRGIVEFSMPKEGVDFIGRSTFSAVCPCIGNIISGSSDEVYNELVSDPSQLWNHLEWTVRELNIRQMDIPAVFGPAFRENKIRENNRSFIESIIKETFKICEHIGCENLILPLPQTAEADEKDTFFLDYYKGFIEDAKKGKIKILITNEDQSESYNEPHTQDSLNSEEITKLIDALNEEAGDDIFAPAFVMGNTEQAINPASVSLKSVINRAGAVILNDHILSEKTLSGIFKNTHFKGLILLDISADIRTNPYIIRQDIVNLHARRAWYLEWAMSLEKKLESLADGKRLVLFGTGTMAESFVRIYGDRYTPVFACDNDSGKWGKNLNGIEIKAPEALKELDPEQTGIVVCNRYYDEVTIQLHSMGMKYIEWFNDEFFYE